MLTLNELERRAYISGNVELANAYGAQMDSESEQIEELEHEVRHLKETVDNLEAELLECDCG